MKAVNKRRAAGIPQHLGERRESRSANHSPYSCSDLPRGRTPERVPQKTSHTSKMVLGQWLLALPIEGHSGWPWGFG